jgi:hypothetical protein
MPLLRHKTTPRCPLSQPLGEVDELVHETVVTPRGHPTATFQLLDLLLTL